MDTATIALIISAFSAVMAGLSLAWNIYRDIILKPRLRIDLSICFTNPREPSPEARYIAILITNFGPGSTTINTIYAKDTSLLKWICRRTQLVPVLQGIENPVNQLPRKLETGEQVDLYLPYDERCLLRRNWSHIGVIDNFGKLHWATPFQVKHARKVWLRDFGSTQNSRQ